MSSTSRPPRQRYGSLAIAAEYLGCSEKHIRRLIASGEITGYRLGKNARAIRVDLDELDAMLRPIPTAGGGSVA